MHVLLTYPKPALQSDNYILLCVLDLPTLLHTFMTGRCLRHALQIPNQHMCIQLYHDIIYMYLSSRYLYMHVLYMCLIEVLIHSNR